MSRRTILLIAGITVVIILGIVATFALTNKTGDTDEAVSRQDAVPKDLEDPQPLKIDNFYNYPGIDSETRDVVEYSINNYLQDYTSKSVSPIGLIRDGSYKESTKGTTSHMEFLVDIENMQRTYKVTFDSDTSTGEDIMYTLCPTEKELRYAPFNCKDDLTDATQ